MAISWGIQGEDPFLVINILRAMSGDVSVTVTSILAENDFSHFPEENLRGGA